ncbi:MAG: GDSL-type esterase/lipase family protein [Candidatus Alcyoniella australis]|nr:GDSL-type esterase/lipase family protein [Candidatus Alcyoniella australis]
MSAARRALFAVVAVLALLALGELVCRLIVAGTLADQSQHVEDGYRYAGGKLRYDAELGWSVECEPGASPGWAPLPSDLRHKPADVFRLFVVGDSVAYGANVQTWRTFAALVGQGLDQSFPGRRHEVFNAAVPGYDLTQMALRLERDVLPHQPDLVLVCADPFDVRPELQQGISERRRNGPLVHKIQGLLHHSRMYYLLSLALIRARHSIEKTPFGERGHALEIIEAVFQRADVAHLYVPVAMLESDRRSFYQEGRQWYQRSGLDWVDTYPALQSALDEQGADALLISPVHLTGEGHRLVAEEILRYLDEHPGKHASEPGS